MKKYGSVILEYITIYKETHKYQVLTSHLYTVCFP